MTEQIEKYLEDNKSGVASVLKNQNVYVFNPRELISDIEQLLLHNVVKSDSDVVADIRNKLGSVTALIDLIKLRKTEHADYAESKLDAQILQAIESIQYIKQL